MSERHVTVGWLSQSTRFELIVTGPYDVRQIDYLIRKLELDRQILMDNCAHTVRISENTSETQPVDTDGEA